ncbi:GtrA family protein [Synechococcus sp. LTW-R]|uniref:GtrA family protein n=1 Tax=Synechococcus sp. LTW-R TaxID=2751170 RepID=UPI001626FD36|nr:GtrA family protein [Synechococcus sp. LTW-R]QNG29019.1 GtrA family protein [Synechococcus sp. LTW-R]
MLKGSGRKRRFLGYGALNLLATNVVLQGLLLVMGTGLATFLSQLLNVGLGFVLYGKRVFRVERLQKRSALSYALMALCLWWCNWAGIDWLAGLGLTRNLAALILIPVLAALSYAVQKLVVFRQ